MLFEGIENEKERIYKEKRKLNPVFIELIENTLDIYRGIFAVMCRKKENQLSVSKVKRVDRKASLMAYLKGHTESFVSCTKGEYDDEFAIDKNYGMVISICKKENKYFDSSQFKIKKHADKKSIKNKFDKIIEIYEKDGCLIKEVIESLFDNGFIPENCN